MITILLLLGVLSVSAVGVLIFQAYHAPVGHEDAEGFHFSPESAPVRISGEAYRGKSAHDAAGHATAHQLPAI